jgi:cytochrome c oxidase subunit II
MFQILLAAGLVLIILILLMIFRIHTLINVMRGTDKKVVTYSNKINALLFVLFLIGGSALFAWYSISEFNTYTLPLASIHGEDTDLLFWVTMGITGFVFILTHIILFVFPYIYQFKSERKALFYPDNTKLEIIWTIIPAITLSVIVFSGWKVWSDITKPYPDDAEQVEIMGFQFAWKVRYPGQDGQLGNYDFRLIDAENQFGMDFSDEASMDDFVPREIHIPKGQPVVFKIRSRDVLHSVFAPHFRLKMDAVPGMPTRFWFVPTKTTAEMREETGNPDFNYEIACTEICGRGHFAMRILVVVDEPEAYREWYASQTAWTVENPEYVSAFHDDKLQASKGAVEPNLGE